MSGAEAPGTGSGGERDWRTGSDGERSGAGHRAGGATVSGAESANIGHGGATVSGGRPVELGRDRSGERGRVRSTGLAEITAGSGAVSRVGAAGTGPGPWPSVVPGWAAPVPCGLRRAGLGSGRAWGGEDLGVRAGQHRASRLGPAAAVWGRAPRVLPVISAGPARNQLGGSPGLPPWAAGLRRPLHGVAGGSLGVAAPRSCARRWLCPRPRPELLLGGRGPGTAFARCCGALTQTGLLRAQSHTWGHRVLLSRPPRIASTSLSLPAGLGLPIAHRWACEAVRG